MQYPNDSRRCLTVLDQDSTLIAVIEMSLSSWLVAGIVPGIERQPLKKLEADKHALLKLLHRWRDERAGSCRCARPQARQRQVHSRASGTALCGRAYATTSEFRSPSETAYPVCLPNEPIVKRTAYCVLTSRLPRAACQPIRQTESP